MGSRGVRALLGRPAARQGAEGAPALRAERLPENSRLTRGPAGSLDLTLHAVINEEFITWVLGFGPAVQVITPRRLQEQMCDQLRATLAQYETA
ncbi:MAG: hypothetical protein CVU59_02470 [Deltaproteobacteria bacterium HGW-Deltaproteobacteria-17]|nr:MAG: hypothetical protein CVU59_02470 [Deltaproteobacteria bacterium HGW-Deltaproteobacteria-17]